MTEQEKLDDIIEFLSERDLDNGGYPYATEWIGKTLVVASLDHDGGTQVDTYKRHQLLKRYDKACLMAVKDGGSWACWWYETGD